MAHQWDYKNLNEDFTQQILVVFLIEKYKRVTYEREKIYRKSSILWAVSGRIPHILLKSFLQFFKFLAEKFLVVKFYNENVGVRWW